jgi:putative adhesin
MSRRARILGRSVLLLCATAVSSGCWRHREREVANAWQWSETLPAGTTIHLRNMNGSIRVRPTNGDKAMVVASERWRFGRQNDVQFLVKRVGSDVYVCAIWGKRGQCDENGYHSRSRGMFRFFGFHWGTDATANLRLDLPAGIKLDAQTSNGGLDIAGASAGGRARTVNGGVVVKQSSGAFDVSSVNGSINVALDSVSSTDTLNVETTNGSVRAELPNSFSGAVSLSTVNGGLHTDMPVTTTGALTRRNLDGRIGTGQQLVRIRTINGGITLARRS